jgi:hypothetical protein
MQNMISSSVETAIEAVVTQLSRELGERLQASLLFGSVTQGFYQPGESDVNLLFVVQDGTDIFDIRAVFLPLWREYGKILRHAPLIVPQSSFRRIKQVDPVFAYHLAEHGRFLSPSPHNDNLLKKLPPRDPHDAVARLATEALQASLGLLPALLPPPKAPAASAYLRKIARKIGRRQIPVEETAVETYARIQHTLAPQIARLPAGKAFSNSRIPAVTAPFLPGLQSLYKEGNNIVMVLAHLTAADIRRTDWEQMTERLAEECSGLILTSAAQLSLSLVYDTPIALKTGRFQHNWGMNPLHDLQTSIRHLMRNAAFIPGDIEINQLPHALLTQNDDQLHAIIHDFQNHLLNIQLAHELLHRFGDTDRFTPPEPLPERDADPRIRVEGIFNHLRWWADFYWQQMNSHPA